MARAQQAAGALGQGKAAIWNLHLGVGFGTTSAADRLVFKAAFEMPLGEKH